MPNSRWLYRLGLGGALITAPLFMSACEPGNEELFPEGTNLITVLVRDGLAYPIYQFNCAGVEESGVSDDCPEGFGCDESHYHGTARAFGRVEGNGIADLRYAPTTTEDPDHCLCGWGKVSEADVRDLTAFHVDVIKFNDWMPLDVPTGRTIAQTISADPCGG